MRAGTTFLRAALNAHPGIAPSLIAEPHYFSWRWPEGASARRAYPLRAPAWLRGGKEPLRLDSSPYYLFHPFAPARVRETLGASVKAIVLLREPGARAWSHYRLSLLRGHEHLGFLDALDAEERRLAGEAARIARGDEYADAPHQVFSYAARGLYARQLARWWTHVPRARFLLLKSDDLFRESQATFDRVCRFLEIPPATLPPNLARNDLPPLPMPERARARLDEIFAEPNAELAALTGIPFADKPWARPAEAIPP